MKELKQIIQKIKELQSLGEICALATVVNVRGSAYRRQGARMLFSAKGREAGFVSAACLEADLLEKAKVVIEYNKPMLFTFDTTAPEDAIFGIGQGCGGYVEIFVEPILPKQSKELLTLLQKSQLYDDEHVIAVAYNAYGNINEELGTRFLITKKETHTHFGLNEINEQIKKDAIQLLMDKKNAVKRYELPNGKVDVFFQFIPANTSLIIFGATPDVKPLVKLAAEIGWTTIVIDHRSKYAIETEFPEANKVLVIAPDKYSDKLNFTHNSFAVIMIHQFEAEAAALRFLFTSPVNYIGLLGPKGKSASLIKHISSNGFTPTKEQLSKLYNPVGLDIGAETAEEIAVSIIAEIQAVIKNRNAGFLKDRQGPIH